ncbi:hypothetical protein M408DRAFT_9979 [Serendipita vermifera MAFF 305830]|uniref:F-box domain-containing protein n=1 Tax=Serendipita vermifera MAFF 305830 TaxID=933852 RepID=A0A0C3B2E2_SERVB|nr:hypothetical protein M408DRAFT_9979 [Serendipita vermifera MAFF 305830]
MSLDRIFSTDPAADAVENPNAIRDWLELPDAVPQQWAIIRQVCRSWQLLIDQLRIRYRYTRLRDLNPTFVGTSDTTTRESLIQAQRIQGSSFWSPTSVNRDRTADHESSIMGPLLSSLPKDAIFHAKTITEVDYKVCQMIIDPYATAFPHLRCLAIDVYRLNLSSIFPNLSSNLPFLTFLSLYSSVSFGLSPEVSLQMGSLTALKLTTPRHFYRNPSFNQWSLPCLRYMDIGNIMDIYEFNGFLKALALFGRKLECLRVTIRSWDGDEREYDHLEGEPMTELWNHCPNLQRLHIPLYLVTKYRPTSLHPLRYLTNSDSRSQYEYLLVTNGQLSGDLKDTTIAFCQATPNLVVLRDSHDWTSIESQTTATGAAEGENAVTKREREACQLMVETTAQMQALGMASHLRVKLWWLVVEHDELGAHPKRVSLDQMTATSLPAELWLTIFEHAMFVDQFFSTDPATDSVENPNAIRDWIQLSNGARNPILEQWGNIRQFLSIYSTGSINIRPEIAFRMESLKALKLTTRGHLYRGISFAQWSIPCLRYLDIGNILDVYEFNQFLGTLPILGRNLEVLQVTIRNWDQDEDDYLELDGGLMSELWGYCPNLQRLHFPLYLLVNHKPTSYHPLRYLTNSNTRSQYAYLLAASQHLHTANVISSAGLMDTMIAFCQAIPNLVTFRDSHDWTLLESEPSTTDATAYEISLMEREKEACQLMVETVEQMQALQMTLILEHSNLGSIASRKSMSTPFLPAEIWLMVFKHAVFVGSIFSTDPATDSIENPNAIQEWLEQPVAGEAIFQRCATIRQVCRSWKALVDRAGDSELFVDADTAIVAQKRLTKALRIQGTSIGEPEWTGDPFEGVVGQMFHSLPKDVIFHARIITEAGEKLMRSIIGSHATAFPYLRCLTINVYSVYPDRPFPNLSSNLPFLTFLSLSSTTSLKLRPENPLQMESLKTLKLTSQRWVSLRPSFGQWSLPSLKYLEIGDILDVATFSMFLKILPLIGRKLEVLRVTILGFGLEEEEYIEFDRGLMSELWDHCPSLQRLHIPLYFVVEHKPTSYHPLRYLTNSDTCSQFACLLGVNADQPNGLKDTMIAFCQAFPDLVAFQDSHDWGLVGSEPLTTGAAEEESRRPRIKREACQLMVKTVEQMQALQMTRLRMKSRLATGYGFLDGATNSPEGEQSCAKSVVPDDQSVAELMKARRIEGMTSSIVSIRGRNIGAGTREREVTSVRRIWEELLDQEGATFQAEIITHAGPQLSDLIVESNPKAFPHLKSLCLEIYYLNPDPILRGLSNNHPSMRFLSLVGHSTITLSSQGFLRLPFLTTLIITTRIDIGEESVFDKWHLPSLFYLEVGCFRSINCLGRLFEVLAQFGQKLRSLNVTFPRAFTEPYDDRDADLMSRLWDSCPMLRNLRAPLYLVLPHPPPLGHPLEHVVNSDITSYHSGCLVARGWLPFNYTDAVLSFCSATPCLVLIRDSHVWKSSEGPHDSVRGAQSTDLYELMCETALQKEDTGLAARYEDSNGNTLIEWFQWNP